MQDKKEQRISTRYPFDLLEELRKLAKVHQRSFNGEVIWALQQYVTQQKEKKV
jgi:Arc-like DNA binding domain